MRLLPYLLLVGIAVMTSCGVPDGPVAQETTATVGVETTVTISNVETASPLPVEPSPAGAPTDVPQAAPVLEEPVSFAGAEPQAGEVLLRDVWGASLASSSSTRFMLYSETTSSSSDGTTPPTITIWKIDLTNITQRTVLSTIPEHQGVSTALQGEMAPNTRTLAYMRTGAIMDSRAELVLMPVDGGSETIISDDLSAAGGRGRPSFAWSPDSSKLAYIVPNPEGQAFYLYDLQTNTSRLLYQHTWGGMLGAWLDNERILVFLAITEDQPLQLRALNTATGAQEILGWYPTRSLFTIDLSPDKNRILLSNYIYQIEENRFIEQPQLENTGEWSYDSQSIIEFIQPDIVTFQVSSVTSNKEVYGRLQDEANRGHTIVLHGFSLDGRYLALCEAGEDVNDRSKYRIRNLVYEITLNRWFVLSQGILSEGQRCGVTLGWL
jgi:hypothetical protein